MPDSEGRRPQPPQAPLLTVSVESLEEGRLFRVRGELDMGTVEALESHVDAALEESSAVVVDLADVSFIDSCGLRLLLRSSARARDLGSPFFLARPSDQVKRLLVVTGTVGLVPVLDGQGGLRALVASS